MVDANSGLVVLGSAYGGAKLVAKLLGPTAEYLGDGLRGWTARRVQNVGRVFEKATQKLGSRIDAEEFVPPRVLKEVLAEASYCDDDLMAEYFGGVLASSRTGVSRDDRGASYMKLVASLSTYQIRCHFLLYRAVRALFVDSGLRPNFIDDLNKMAVFFPSSDWTMCMGFSDSEPVPELTHHCTMGLDRLGLLRVAHTGDKEYINERNRLFGWVEVLEGGVCMGPTKFGIELWRWGIGAAHVEYPRILLSSEELPALPKIPPASRVVKLIQA